MPYSLKRQQQVGCMVQTDEFTPGVTGTTPMAAAAYSRELSEDSRFTANALSFERGSRKGSLSKSGKLLGPGIGEIVWMQELSGGGPLTADAASWYEALRACGFGAPTILKKVTIDGSGTVGATVGGSKRFKPGDRIGDNATEGSATKTGTVVAHFIPASGNAETLVYIPGTGTFGAADEIHNYTQSGLHSPCDSVPTDAGKRFTLLSTTSASAPPFATVEQRTDGKIFRIVAARGNAKFVFEHGKPAMVEFTFRGPWDRNASNNGPYTAGLVGSIPVPPKPLLIGEAGFPFTFDETHSPVLTKSELDLGNQLGDRKTINDNGIVIAGVPLGYLGTTISDRRPVIGIDPESVPVATYDYMSKWQTETGFRYRQRTGRADDTGSGAVQILLPAAQLDNDSWSQQEREGVITEDLKILATGSADDELTIDHYFV